MAGHSYDATFFNYIESGAIASSQVLLPIVHRAVKNSSVLDVGCGRGAWLSSWEKQGVDDVFGVDGVYVDQQQLLISKDRFIAKDIGLPFDLNRKFDLVQCLEVAEHLPEFSADQLVDNLMRHSDVILFSAAPPGQGGEHHVNEQPYGYWRDKFALRGYVMYDAFRELLVSEYDVLPWYKYNTFLYVKVGSCTELVDSVRASKVCGDVRDLSPLHYRLRKKMISNLPVKLSTWLAVLKKHIICWKLKLQG